MQSGYAVIYRCQACGALHRLALDHSGHYSGPLPCAVTTRHELQLDPQTWRQLVETDRAKVVQ